MNRHTLAAVCTCRWLAVNAAEFDRRHFRSAGRWLFGRRKPRTTRPPRRIVPVALVACWIAMVLHITLPPDVTEAAELVLFSLAAALSLVLVAMAIVRSRRRKSQCQ